MNVNKTQAVLFMYQLLLEKGNFTKEEILDQLEINNLTFLRYIQEIRAYIFNFNSNKELVYSRNNKKYILINIEI